MTKEPNYALDAYDLGRMDMNDRFLKILDEGVKRMKNREDLIRIVEKELNLLESEITVEGMENESV